MDTEKKKNWQCPGQGGTGLKKIGNHEEVHFSNYKIKKLQGYNVHHQEYSQQCCINFVMMIVTRVIVLTISKSTYKERQITHDNTHVEPNFFFF